MEEWIKKIEGRKGRANRQDIKCTIYPKYIAETFIYTSYHGKISKTVIVGVNKF